MSCIAGIVSLDGSPLDEQLLNRMAATMADRAPDGITLWNGGTIGFAHALLNIPGDACASIKPSSLDGNTWITADARIDGRDELLTRLKLHCGKLHPETGDAELILHAYHAYGEKFLDHLIGDFAFALWDTRRQRLLCARDHFGVRPFFYTRTASHLFFASDLDALLVAPCVSSELDENFIADFLLFSGTMDPALSVYRHIKRLLPASIISLESGRLHTSKYWSPPTDPIADSASKSSVEYQAEFLHIFTLAVQDRVRADAVAIELSGGMDSGSIAAILADYRQTRHLDIAAYTNTCHNLFASDEEGYFAGFTASHLNIPVTFQDCAANPLFNQFQSLAPAIAEPFVNPDLAMAAEKLTDMKERGIKVLLTGQTGDALFTGCDNYYASLVRKGCFHRLAREIVGALRDNGSLGGLGLRSAMLGPGKSEPWQALPPYWIAPEFAHRVNLEGRWVQGWAATNRCNDTRRHFLAPWLSIMYERYEALKMPVVVRHPLSDLRLFNFMLSLPKVEMRNKKILRESMRGRLPEAVRTRAKAPLAEDHFRARFVRDGLTLAMTAGLTQSQTYLDNSAYLQEFDGYLQGSGIESTWSSWKMITPVSLGHWLGKFK